MMNFKTLRKSYISKVVISFLTIQLIVGGILPTMAFAAPEGPSQPEFNSFTPIGASDMVDLSSGDFNYSIPIIDVGGYPLSLGYSSATNFDSPSSWVGHGWDLSAGQINRSMRVIPDDFDGTDKITTENSIKPDITFSAGASGLISLAGFDIGKPGGGGSTSVGSSDGTAASPNASLNLKAGLTAIYNNYTGTALNVSFGPSLSVADKFTTSINFSPSAVGGVTISPSVSLEREKGKYNFGSNYNTFANNLSLNSSLSSSRVVDGDKINDNDGTSFGALNFQPAQFNPSYNLGYRNLAASGNFALGGTAFTVDGKFELYGSIATRTLLNDYKEKIHRAYGYNNSHKAYDDGMRDFSRSHDRVITPHISFMSVPQNTYDNYSISGQGISGSFRPQNSQVGYVYDPKVVNRSDDFSISLEGALGNLFKGGGNISYARIHSNSGYWKQGKGNQAHNTLSSIDSPIDNIDLPADYQRTYYKFIGENTLPDTPDFLNAIGGEDPVYFNNKKLLPSNNNLGYTVAKLNTETQLLPNFNSPGDAKILAEERIPSSKTITPITVGDYKKWNNSLLNNDDYANLNRSKDPNGLSKDHHQAGFRITDDGGTIYNYDIPLYNNKSSQINFSISKNAQKTNSYSQAKYSNRNNSTSNKSGRDHFYESRTIDPYVHTSLLRSILSSDYRDLTGNGVSPDDLGSYTLFKYKDHGQNMKYRFPIEKNQGQYQQGSIAMSGDDKASITYGEKEHAYLERIVTKTHVAFFKLNDESNSPRRDKLGVQDVNGGSTVNQRSRYLDKIYLYTLAQAERLNLLKPIIDATPPAAQALKVVHFDYDYSLQKNVTGNSLPDSESGYGKLTLKKVYFTYGSSEMGRYTPYSFSYNNDQSFKYHNLNKDVWGNYQPNVNNYSLTGHPTNAEHGYTQQTETTNQMGYTPADYNVSRFLLSKVTLPSGGDINIQYESDDYTHVQDKDVMSMLRIAGLGSNHPNSSTTLDPNKAFTYNGVDNVNDFIYLELPDNNSINWSSLTSATDRLEKIQNSYLKDLEGQPIFFKIFSNLYKDRDDFSEYITGFVYLESFNSGNVDVFQIGNKYYLSVRVRRPRLRGGSGPEVHPFAKAAWNYSQAYLKSIAFKGDDDSHQHSGQFNSAMIEGVVTDLIDDMGSLLAIFKSPNRTLMQKGCGRKIFTKKSFLRLKDPSGFKKGGGSRVKSVQIDSKWDQMTSASANITSSNTNYYGQEYTYLSKEGNRSSGIATYEPSLSNENPWKLPLADRSNRTPSGARLNGLIDKFLAPGNSNYITGPLMDSYFPNPKVTYSRVEVKNIKPDNITNPDYKINSRGSGYVVNEFYTSKDFPVKEKNTKNHASFNDDNNVGDFIKNIIGFPADMYTRKFYDGAQGFFIETNDMNGKAKSQTVYAENNQEITKSISHYQLDDEGQLDNNLLFIERNGKIIEKEIGVEYDIINDFRYSHSSTYTGYADANFASFFIMIGVAGIPSVIPGGSLSESTTKLTSTAKHLHRTGILKGSTVIDNGAAITTTHLAYDDYSRQPILSQVDNEYKDVIYNLNYPSYWVENEMGNKSINEGMEFRFNLSGTNRYSSAKKMFNKGGLPLLINGDEIALASANNTVPLERFWIHDVNYDSSGNANFLLINKDSGNAVDLSTLASSPTVPYFGKIVRSAYDNKQAQSIASISMSRNPLQDLNRNELKELPDLFEEDYDIFNASAIKMKDRWDPDCECGYGELTEDEDGNLISSINNEPINPYFHNIKGQFRPWKSYAYLTGRASHGLGDTDLRRDGFYREFIPFYMFEDTPERVLKEPFFTTTSPTQEKYSRWQFASAVSKVSPYGLELENRDPLKKPRFSAATYGFNKKFPSAVASNTEYRELAFDGFEDYDYIQHDDEHFDFYKPFSHDVNIDGSYSEQGILKGVEHISVSESHTGNYSFMVEDGQSIGVNHTIIECNDSEDVQMLFLNLLKALWNTNPAVDSNGCVVDLTSIPEFQALRPYIVSNGSYNQPGICNFTATQNTLEFNFYDRVLTGSQSHDVKLYFSCQSDAGFNIDQATLVLDPNYNDAYPQNSYHGSTIYTNYNNGGCIIDKQFVHTYIDFGGEVCIDCTSLSPHQGQSYVLSAWVKEDIDRDNLTTPQQLRDAYPMGYEDVFAEITFTDINGNQISAPGQWRMEPTGEIINGWQKIYGTFTVDSNANVMKVLLRNDSNKKAFFDDLRIHPVNGSMKSFVYDDETFRLKAELDDNNYATFYEYDLEGNLVRIKKETSRGIKTIQESRQSLSKQIILAQ